MLVVVVVAALVVAGGATISMDGRTLGKTTAEVDTSIPGVVGWLVAHVTIPANTPPGTYTLVATCPVLKVPATTWGRYHTTITVARS